MAAARVAGRRCGWTSGMVLKMDGRLYHGEECIHRLAMLSTPSTTFNRINGAIFRSGAVSRALYPVLRSGRNAVLRLLGRPRLGDAAGTPPSAERPVDRRAR